MRLLGGILIVCGCLGGCGSLAEETTVSTSGGDRVHNIGLIAQRQTHLIVSGFAAIAGILLFGFGEVAAARSRAAAGPRCPMCNGVLEGHPRVCLHCRAELRWVDDNALTPEQFAEHERAQAQREKQRRAQVAANVRGAAEQRERIGEMGRVAAATVGRAGKGFFSTIGGAGGAFNGAIRTAAGEGNDIIYRFLQLVVYVGVPGAIAAAVILTRR